MSKIVEINCHIRDLNVLEKACHRIGLSIAWNQKTYRWYGTYRSGEPLPQGFSQEELGQCVHAIQVPQNDRAYEIGIVTRRDGEPGYTLLWDPWNHGYGLEEYIGPNADKLLQMYALELTLQEYAQYQHYAVTEYVDHETGDIHLELMQQGA